MWQYNYTPESDELYHFGIKGQKWGQRRYQNNDGSLTPAGKKRYAKATYADEKKQASARFQSGLKKLQSSGKGNDTDAVTKLSKQYDADRNAAKDKYKAAKKAANAEQNQTYSKAAYDARRSGDLKKAKAIEAAGNKGSAYCQNIMAGALGGGAIGEALNLRNRRTGSMAARNILVGAGLGVAVGTLTATKDVVTGSMAVSKKNKDHGG